MDDGSFNKSKAYLILCTDSYSREDVLHLIYILKNKFNLTVSVHSAWRSGGINKGYTLYISTASMTTFSTIIKPYVLPSLYYKLGATQP